MKSGKIPFSDSCGTVGKLAGSEFFFVWVEKMSTAKSIYSYTLDFSRITLSKLLEND